jgi:hypothetical protein
MLEQVAPTEDRVGPLLNQILQAQAQTSALLSAVSLEAIAKRMVALADELGLQALHGASEAGTRLVGAMLLLSGGMSAWEGQAQAVLLMDGVVVSPLGVRTTAAHLLRLGATAVHGAVLDVLQANTVEAGQQPLVSLTVLSH